MAHQVAPHPVRAVGQSARPIARAGIEQQHRGGQRAGGQHHHLGLQRQHAGAMLADHLPDLGAVRLEAHHPTFGQQAGRRARQRRAARHCGRRRFCTTGGRDRSDRWHNPRCNHRPSAGDRDAIRDLPDSRPAAGCPPKTAAPQANRPRPPPAAADRADREPPAASRPPRTRARIWS